MPTLREKQENVAIRLLDGVLNVPPDRHALFNLVGEVGVGKSTVLGLIAARLRSRGLIPLRISVPQREADSAAMVMLEASQQLKAAQLANGDLAALSDPRTCWSRKMGVFARSLEANADKLVVLCDEPARWHGSDDTRPDDLPVTCAKEIAGWVIHEARLRRIVTDRLPDGAPTTQRVSAPRLDDGIEALSDAVDWDRLRPVAEKLREGLPQPLKQRTIWEMKLWVGLAAVDSVEQARATAHARELLSLLLDRCESRTDLEGLCRLLAVLALARTEISAAVLADLAADLPPLARALVSTVFCHVEQDRVSLHPLVRLEVFRRSRDRRKRDACHWQLPDSLHRKAHERLAREYEAANADRPRDAMESLHHAILGGAEASVAGSRVQFAEQLHAIGRTLSYIHREHRRAAELFRLSLEFAPDQAYGHHYLAFNLDWLAEEQDQVERHYRRAIELQPTHPWWWSRWISYLATRGRFREAHSAWNEANDWLSIDEGNTPDWIYLSLHRWVARWLLHWAELDFAEEVLRSIPQPLADTDLSIRTLFDLLAALRKARSGVAVFPLSVPCSEWWSPRPHTKLPLKLAEQPLRSWLPARVDALDSEAGNAFLTIAEFPQAEDDEPAYRELTLTRPQVERTAEGFGWKDLKEGSFLELAYYGEAAELRIGLHRDTEWRDPHLLPLAPRPDRWFRRAVAQACESTKGTT